MKLQYLRYFLAVCDYQNITKAAQALHITQPSLTYAIRELEKEFNIQLMIRKSHGLALTKEGQMFRDICRNLIHQADIAERAMHDLSGKHSTIRLGIPPMMGATIFPKWYEDIHRQFPEITFQRFEHGSIVLRRMLLEGKLDCAIFPDEISDQEYFDKVPIAQARYVCCVGKDHPLAGQASVTVDQLEQEPFVILDSSFANNQYVHRLFARYGLTPNIVMETNQFSTIIEMVSTGQAISFAYQAYVELHPNLMVGIPVEDDADRQVISLMWVRERYLLGDLNKIITYIKEI